ncbi:MAG: GNAT family N-acetyltransferase [Herpetosiphonaceae bacterium]|nr:GNAT family N-acetyltransferase [Herpetosiphonaceae bacterium]
MLQGEKTSLRAWEQTDLPRWHELSRSVYLMQMGGGDWYPEPLARLEYWFKKSLEKGADDEFAIMADGKLIGGVGLHHSDRRSGTTSFGIGIYDEAYVGRGYGSDALRVFLTWVFETQNWRRLWLTTWSTNQRAYRAYQKLGFVEEGRCPEEVYCDGAYVDEVIMGLLREEWQARRSRGVSHVKG